MTRGFGGDASDGMSGARRRRRRIGTPQVPLTPEDWTVGEDDEPTLTRVEGPTALTGELARLARRPGWSERLGAVRMWSAWEAIVGRDLMPHCEPVRLAGRVLVIRAASPVWATQLRYLTTQLLERSTSVLGAGSVREVRVVVGRLEGRPTVAERSSLGDTHRDRGLDPDDPGPTGPEDRR